MCTPRAYNLHVKPRIAMFAGRGRFISAFASVIIAASLVACSARIVRAADDGLAVLHATNYRHYVLQFMKQEVTATGKAAADPWTWMLREIPWFDASDKQFEQMYYFRWYAWQKHVVKAPGGYLITEWMPKPDRPDFGVLCDAAAHQLREARWLRDPAIAADYARYWTLPGSDPHKYSFALADSIRAVTLATGDDGLGISLLPKLVANYHDWEQSSFDPVGLFFSIDTRDAMEKSISGNGYRPTLNSYMYGDALAIADFATRNHDEATASQFRAIAAALRRHIESDLWNTRDEFYEVRAPRGSDPRLADVRELIGYIPWYFDEPPTNHAVAWKQLFDPQGFAAEYGPTTAERRSPRFRFKNSDKCQWNGPSWPFATTQTLVALANLLNGSPQQYVSRRDYYHLFSTYVAAQHLKLASGESIPWIDEDFDADTDEWITRDILFQRHSDQFGRGNYYNHSGFADPLITGLVGLRPRADNKIVLHPLLPPSQWSYFALDGLPYHGHMLSVVYDSTGAQYHRGRGFMLFVDGQKRASRSSLGDLVYELPAP